MLDHKQEPKRKTRYRKARATGEYRERAISISGGGDRGISWKLNHTQGRGDAHAVTVDIQPVRGDPVERYVVPTHHRLSTLTGMLHLGMRETNRHLVRTATSPELRNASSAQNKISGTRGRSLSRSRDSPPPRGVPETPSFETALQIQILALSYRFILICYTAI